MTLQIVILAAGKGKRMHSNFPKVLHKIAAKPLLEHVICTALKLSEQKAPIIIYGHQGEIIQKALSHYDCVWLEQKDQLGTGHALLQALAHFKDEDRVLVLYGDVPLISVDTLRELIEQTADDAFGLLTAEVKNPLGYGRIIRDHSNQVVKVVEEQDANEEERLITEINSGIYLLKARYLKKYLPLLKPHTQGEYYLTDIIHMAREDNISLATSSPYLVEEIQGVNNREQLAQAERYYQRRFIKTLLHQGVSVADPERVDIRGSVEIGRDVYLDINVILEGHVKIGDGCIIGPHSILRNSTLGNQVEVRANTMIDGADISSHVTVGPFARIRPGTILKDEVHIGNFVEIKNSEIGTRSKVNHLSYLGDSTLGQEVNVGAGTITCNYDGINKHKTIIGDRVLIGSDSTLVAPITLHNDVFVASATTVRKDVPEGSLVFNTREEQLRVGWTMKYRQKQHEETELP